MRTIQIPRRFVRSEWGGTETVVWETTRRLIALGHPTTVICPKALTSKDREIVGGVPVRRVSYFYPYVGLTSETRQQLDLKGGNMFSFELMHVLRKSGADILHLHTGKRIGGIARHVARERGIPYVISLHGGVYDVPSEEAAAWTRPTRGTLEWGKLLGWWVGSRRVLNDAAAVLCVSREECVRAQQALPRQRVYHIPNGVNVDRFRAGDGTRFRRKHGIPVSSPVILTVGRIDTQKNQLLGIQALSEVDDGDQSTQLVIVGPVTDAAYLSRLRAEIRSRGLSDRVTVICGLDPDSQELVDAYHAADVFFLPSVHEPFGIVILEAWAAGKPVVASRVGGIPDFVGHGTNGLLFDPHRSGDAIEALRGLLSNKGLGERLAAEGQWAAENEFSWDRITQRLATLYDTLAAEKHSYRASTGASRSPLRPALPQGRVA
jgi:glycosyltransferase involved in cell wall biosynthesis